MGRLLKDNDKNFVSHCNDCDTGSNHNGCCFIYNVEDLLAGSEEAQKAYEWFSNRNFDVPPADVIDKRGSFTDEEMGYIFVLEEFIDRILAEEPECLSCFKEKQFSGGH